jgi:hypothetical protein
MFAAEQEKFVESINGHNEEQYIYLDTFLRMQHAKIQSCIESYLMSNTDMVKALFYMKLQSLHLRLMCQNYPGQVLERVKRITKGEIKFALDKCLEICEEYNQIEACAILTNKMTNYLSSATRYLSLLTTENLFNYPLLIKQVS